MRYQLAVFDMDGTILNTLEDLADSLNFALKKSDYPRRSIEEVRRFVGNGIGKLIERGVPDGTDAESTKRVYSDFTEHYAVHCADKTKPYEGIIHMLSSLRQAGYKTAVVSNKADYAVQELCSQYFYGLFDSAVGEREGVRRKPAPDSVNHVLQQLNIKRENAVYIGDSEVDIATAENAMMDSIIVDWGFRERSFLAQSGAKTIISSPVDIKTILDGTGLN